MSIQKYISTEEAYSRGYVLQSPVTISGPRDKMNDESMNKCIHAVAELFIARQNNLNHQRRLMEECGTSDLSTAAYEYGENDVYVRMATSTSNRFDRALINLNSTYQITGLVVHYT